MGTPIQVHNIDTHDAKRHLNEKIHTRSFQGVFRRVRIIAGTFLFALFFGTVWLTWNDRQAVLWDLSAKKFHIFSSTFWPQDLVLLSAILIVCAFGLFFLTVWAGRVWCGYTCPQSVWMWVFMWVEKVSEGDRNQRKKLDQAPFTGLKVYKRFKKHGLWLLISVFTAITFVGYFTPIRDLVPALLTFQAGGSAFFWVFFFTLATYLNAGWLREKVCVHMCPYGRFQSSMLDKDSLVISYDVSRGEARGGRSLGSDYKAKGLGDCVDCQMCVQVCPTGIDIRDGLQIDCIGCAACIDACDSVMEKMGYEKGLIRYTSERELNGGRLHIMRPRLVAYGALLVAMVLTLGWAIASRPLVSFDVAKDRGLYRFNAQGEIENSYTLKIINKSHERKQFNVSVKGLEGLNLIGPSSINLRSGEKLELPLSVSVKPALLAESMAEIEFYLTQSKDSDLSLVAKSRFTGRVP
ncbi:cytochrome c oxidase accessory protein CcoG [Marinobacter salexigens]|uniref:Cytochrome c oxidase accessory protein CcoG n=1 Tax=Marinobacter salexigens TaxID=1925763 RepID=A0ABS6ACQ7_9GAMM|nr:cytochrome c oxidase accessory protein CcoG [Marinobacter salexigens]MBU2875762.1 cytochrome c oxidase accessory protein CcoG [Marinobacter salexigens]